MESGVGMPHGGYTFCVPSAFLCCVNSLRLKSSMCSCMTSRVSTSAVNVNARYSTFVISSQKLVWPGFLYSQVCHLSLYALRFASLPRPLAIAAAPAALALAAADELFTLDAAEDAAARAFASNLASVATRW